MITCCPPRHCRLRGAGGAHGRENEGAGGQVVEWLVCQFFHLDLVSLMSCIFYFAGQLCILVLQEDNPFKLPSDDKIFAMREEERQRRAEERERVKHLHVWEKVSLSCSRFKCVISEKT